MPCEAELLSFLRKKPRKTRVVTMPDFFLDRIIDVGCDPSRFSSMIKTVAERKGGSVDGIPQTDFRGGNAVNTASALAALGVEATPLVCTNAIGLEQMRNHLKLYKVDLSHVKMVERASVTTALEFRTELGRANVMLRDVGSLSDFGPNILTEYDYKVIKNADYVCLFNWAGTKNFGTELAETIFNNVKSNGRGTTYLDTADPAPNITGVPGLIDKVLKTPLVDVLSLNENEATLYANCLETSPPGKNRTDLSKLALEFARVLVKHFSARIDLHTTNFSASLSKNGEVIVPAFDIRPLRATGAGDAWNAGNILADACGLSDECRLALANAVSACYLSSPDGLHPTRQQLMRFLESNRFLPLRPGER